MNRIQKMAWTHLISFLISGVVVFTMYLAGFQAAVLMLAFLDFEIAVRNGTFHASIGLRSESQLAGNLVRLKALVEAPVSPSPR